MEYQSIRVMIVDDHKMVRKGLRLVLEQFEGICVTGEASNGLEAIELVEQLNPDVILMDLSMPGMNGVDAIQRIMATQPNQHIIVLTGFLDEERAVEAIKAGAQGCADKNISPEELIRVIWDVYSGNPSLRSDLAWRILRRSSSVQQPRRSKDTLSERELQILLLMAQGKLDQEIAQELVITEVTIRTHISRMLAKLGLENRVQAVLYCLRSGLISITEIPDVMETRWL